MVEIKRCPMPEGEVLTVIDYGRAVDISVEGKGPRVRIRYPGSLAEKPADVWAWESAVKAAVAEWEDEFLRNRNVPPTAPKDYWDAWNVDRALAEAAGFEVEEGGESDEFTWRLAWNNWTGYGPTVGDAVGWIVGDLDSANDSGDYWQGYEVQNIKRALIEAIIKREGK